MNHFTRTTALLRRGATTAAAVLLAALPVQAAHAAQAALPVQAAHAAQDSHPRPRHTADQSDWLYVTVSHGDDARTGDSRGALLRCEPPQGHPHAAAACDQLRSAHGDIRVIPHKEVFCSMIYAPVTVQARGQWQGRAVDYTETFPNACVMRARTGDVFALDQ
ncbi:SSI family serine proteinase inhibitor [Streptomyces sp. NPDC014748]|uniref:SSI family serine proteinase inhibitor n=1 Tax=unclassified Streptomyces TaxID=2593676 RepID=UPI00146BE265|nr:SSI family serine proteinase inhibitor [Streptomyces sp. GMY02]NMO33680.1 serine protease [Streptomyces sp. GMY02]